MATKTDRRSSTKEKPVWEIKLDQMTFTNADWAIQSETVPINGVVTHIRFVSGDSGAADRDMVWVVYDTDDNQLFTTTENDNATVLDYAGGDFALYQITTQHGLIITAVPDAAPSVGENFTADVTIRGF